MLIEANSLIKKKSSGTPSVPTGQSYCQSLQMEVTSAFTLSLSDFHIKLHSSTNVPTQKEKKSETTAQVIPSCLCTFSEQILLSATRNKFSILCDYILKLLIQ